MKDVVAFFMLVSTQPALEIEQAHRFLSTVGELNIFIFQTTKVLEDEMCVVVFSCSGRFCKLSSTRSIVAWGFLFQSHLKSICVTQQEH